MGRGPSLVHERSVHGATLRAYISGRHVVVVRGPEEDEWLSREAVEAGSASSDAGHAADLCTYYGVPRGAVTVTITKPDGRREAGTYALADCVMKLSGPSRRLRGGWPRSERQWRDLYLFVTSQVLVAATLPAPSRASAPLYKYSKMKRPRKLHKGSRR